MGNTPNLIDLLREARAGIVQEMDVLEAALAGIDGAIRVVEGRGALHSPPPGRDAADHRFEDTGQQLAVWVQEFAIAHTHRPFQAVEVCRWIMQSGRVDTQPKTLLPRVTAILEADSRYGTTGVRRGKVWFLRGTPADKLHGFLEDLEQSRVAG